MSGKKIIAGLEQAAAGEAARVHTLPGATMNERLLTHCGIVLEQEYIARFGRPIMYEDAQALARAIIPIIEAATARRCAEVVGDHNKVGREWIPGSLWDSITREAVGRILAEFPDAEGRG